MIDLMFFYQIFSYKKKFVVSGDDTAANVRRLCIRAAYPFAETELKFLNADVTRKIHTAAVCVYPNRVHDAYEALNSLELGQQIEIAAGKFYCSEYSIDPLI